MGGGAGSHGGGVHWVTAGPPLTPPPGCGWQQRCDATGHPWVPPRTRFRSPWRELLGGAAPPPEGTQGSCPAPLRGGRPPPIPEGGRGKERPPPNFPFPSSPPPWEREQEEDGAGGGDGTRGTGGTGGGVTGWGGGRWGPDPTPPASSRCNGKTEARGISRQKPLRGAGSRFGGGGGGCPEWVPGGCCRSGGGGGVPGGGSRVSPRRPAGPIAAAAAGTGRDWWGIFITSGGGVAGRWAGRWAGPRRKGRGLRSPGNARPAGRMARGGAWSLKRAWPWVPWPLPWAGLGGGDSAGCWGGGQEASPRAPPHPPQRQLSPPRAPPRPSK